MMDIPEYEWTSKEGIRTKISFSANFDNIITRFKQNEVSESAFLMDCGIVYHMPKIMRYCLENNLDLRSREYLCSLIGVEENLNETSKFAEEISLPLIKDGTIRNEDGKLAIYSCPEKFVGKGKVSFDSKEVPRFLEGMLRVLDCSGVKGAHFKCAEMVSNYITYHYIARKDYKFKPNQ